MRIQPQSTITLYKNVEIDNGEQLAFSNIENQRSYFNAKKAADNVNCTVVRKTGTLRVDIPGGILSQCNYLSFINPNFDNKTIYARIIDYEYINNECAEISYVIDYWQTWMFDVRFEDMYIDRECLSEEDWGKAQTNPYDPSIFEFRTDEPLQVSKDLEPLNYEVGEDTDSDGYRLTRAIDDVVDVDGTMGVLIKFNNIDFANLDSGTDQVSAKPSFLFCQWLYLHVFTGANNFGFFKITPEMYSYIYAHQSDAPEYRQITGAYMVGSAWKERENNTRIYPLKSSNYEPGCCIAYCPTIEDASRFVYFMTMWNNIDGIIDMSIIPNNLMVLCGIPSAYAGGSPYKPTQLEPNLNVTNRKLFRFPFSFLRVLSPNGDIKEYKYEYFKSMRNNENRQASLLALLDVTDRPVLILAPQGYKYTGLSNSYGADANVNEAIYFDQFPTMPITIDAWTAQIAATANYTIGNKTIDNAADLASADIHSDKWSQAINFAQGMFGGAGGAVSGAKGLADDPGLVGGSGLGGALSVGSALAGTGSLYTSQGDMQLARKKFEAASERWQTAESALTDAGNSKIAEQLRLTKPAYACDKYMPSNGIGVTNFNVLGYCDLVFMRVRLSDEILRIYDNYFTHYGYTSGRCGIPRIINYCNGSTNDSEVPHWLTVNGRPSTYIKTMDCKVIYSMVPVASYIKGMFDSGVRMIKGDPS